MKKILLSIITLAAFNFGATAQNVNIPDVNFKACLLAIPNIDINNDSEVQVSEANAYNADIECVDLNISDLTGLEAFTSLKGLDISDNNITDLNISQNTALLELNCSENNLTELDVSNNTALKDLDCGLNNLTELDVSQNLVLEKLLIRYNDFTSIDVSQNPDLIWFRCEFNSISSVTLSQNPSLELIACNNNVLTELYLKNVNPIGSSLNALYNPNLTCIEVDNIAAATTSWTFIDSQTSFSTSCSPVLVTSITVQGQGGASTISTMGGTLQMEAEVLPMNATNNTYTWSITNTTGSANIDANGLVTAITDGIVNVTATANDGSGASGSIDITITNQSSSIGEINSSPKVSIYPNPAIAQINIDSEMNIDAIKIMDIMGKTVKTIVKPNKTISISDLSKGIYFLQMQMDDTLVSRKIIKE